MRLITGMATPCQWQRHASGNAMPVAFYKATAGVMPGTPAANAASCGKTAIDIDN
jgi:hypothetical protein